MKQIRNLAEEYIFLNGNIVEGHKACLSVFDRGFLYGDGFFETIRVEYGQVLFLKAHLERLYQSCQLFNIELGAKKVTYWSDKINRLIERNNLQKTIAAVKIVVTRGPETWQLGLPKAGAPTVVVYARKYNPPDKEKYITGIAAEVFPYPRHSFLADHKSLNYLFYLSAREWAQKQGADEALVLNFDGTVSEGATTNIFYVREGIVFRPESPHYLRGVMENQVTAFLEEGGKEIIATPTTVSMLTEAEEVFLTNSLVEVIPVARIGKSALPEKKSLTSRLQGVDWPKRSHANRNS